MSPKWYQRADGEWTQRRRRRFPLSLAVIVLLLLIVLGHRWWLPWVARALFVDQAPRPADALLVLGGGDGSRQDRAIALYQEKLAPLIISSGERPYLPDFQRTFAEIGADYMIARGVPAESILLLKETTSTYDEALASLSLAREFGFTSLLVVSDHYHLRRSSLTFRRVYRGSGISLTFVAAYPSWFDVNAWWTQERSLMAVFEEYEKLIYYLLRGYLL